MISRKVGKFLSPGKRCFANFFPLELSTSLTLAPLGTRAPLSGRVLAAPSRCLHSGAISTLDHLGTRAPPSSRVLAAPSRCLHSGAVLQKEVELTSVRYNVERGPFSQVTDADITVFERLVPGRVVTREDDLEGYNTDWLKTVRGKSGQHAA